MLVYAFGLRSAGTQVIEFILRETEMRRTLISNQQALVQAKLEAETASRTKSDFLAHMSHELRTPLNAILGFSETIAGEYFGPVANSRYAAYAQDIHTSGQHLLKLINDILDLSKVEAGALVASFESVHVGDVFQSIERLTNERAESRSLRVSWTRSPAVTSICTDERLLKQVLINLVSNAIKFTPAGGSISVSAERRGREGIAIIVRDTGVGMRPEDIAIALTPFGQVSDNMTARAEGTGLGLPLCERFAKIIGGTLAIESVFGEGTTVTVTLPKAMSGLEVATSPDDRISMVAG
jgi:signal transduction histidine kinase